MFDGPSFHAYYQSIDRIVRAELDKHSADYLLKVDPQECLDYLVAHAEWVPLEWHEKDMDIIYVIDGGATLITGGTMPDAKTTEPGEKRAASIKDGKTQKVAKGDVLTISAARALTGSIGKV